MNTDEEYVQRSLAGKPTLEALSYSLRHPDTWPKDFTWNYSQHGHDAMALAIELWNIQTTKADEKDGYKSIIAKSFSIGYDDGLTIFYRVYCKYRKYIIPFIKVKWLSYITKHSDQQFVTPELVADAIDKYLAKQNGEENG